jgi:hypothetical protein
MVQRAMTLLAHNAAWLDSRGQRRGPRKPDFSHAGSASTAVRVLRTGRNRMNPGFHLALTWWKPRFTSFTTGLTFMINLS